MIFRAKFRRFIYLLGASFRREQAVTGYMNEKCQLVAAAMLIGPGKYVITKVFYTTTGRKEGDVYELHYNYPQPVRDAGE